MSAAPLAWHCERCVEQIGDDAGYLHVNHTEIHHVQREHDAFDKRTAGRAFSVGELLALPELAPWQVHHRDCDPRPGSNDYWIAIERIRSHAAIIGWTAHLMEKNWLRYTNWTSVLHRFADHSL